MSGQVVVGLAAERAEHDRPLGGPGESGAHRAGFGMWSECFDSRLTRRRTGVAQDERPNSLEFQCSESITVHAPRRARRNDFA